MRSSLVFERLSLSAAAVGPLGFLFFRTGLTGSSVPSGAGATLIDMRRSFHSLEPPDLSIGVNSAVFALRFPLNVTKPSLVATMSPGRNVGSSSGLSDARPPAVLPLQVQLSTVRSR